MSTKIFVNQQVKNLNNFKAFGWTFNPQFADETAASLVIPRTSMRCC
jgi:predicted lactoylglutathione lyase